MKIAKLILGLSIFGLAASPVLADHHTVKAIKTTGVTLNILTNAKGMSLYTLDADKPGASVCYGKCAALWPPMLATAKSKGEGEFSVITRKDGAKQWAYRGAPLYAWVKDKKPGDVTGDGVKGATGLWRVARP